MTRRARLGIVIALVGLAIAAIGIISVREILTRSLAPPAAPTERPILTERIVVTTRDIDHGIVLNSNDLALKEVPIDLIPRDALLDIESAVGRFAKAPLVSGEMVLEHHLADPTNVSHDVGYIIGNEQVLMAFPAADLMSGLGILQRGDMVDILVSVEQEGVVEEVDPEGEAVVLPEGEEEEKESRLYTFDALQAVEITAMVADIVYEEEQARGPELPGGEETPEEERKVASVHIRAYLLAVSPQDALVLKHLIDLGGVFDLVLRNPLSNQLFDLTPVQLEYITELYELKIIK